ncbi:MAG: BON domain-containing protein [Rhodobacteraceae bacterium]|nr:BON domain-containing protein [Paracoccaceae bacterium]
MGSSALGWWAWGHTAPDIQNRLSTQARSAVAASIHGATATVSGRDVTLTGLADTDEEREALTAALRNIDGVRTVDDRLSVLPIAAPYRFFATKSADTLSATGVAPTAAAMAKLEEQLAPYQAEITLASGAPEGWFLAIKAELNAIKPLRTATLEISDQTISLRGLAPLPVDARAVEATLEALPVGYARSVDIDIEDDGRPFVLRVDYTRGGAAVAEGKLPVTASFDILAPLDADVATETLSIARIASSDAVWADRASRLVAALSALENGSLFLTEESAGLSGTGTRAGIAAAQDALGDDPGVSREFTILDNGAPIQLTASKGEDAHVSGKLPFGTTPAMLGLEAFDDIALRVAEVEAQSEGFVPLAAAGLRALGSVTTGELMVADDHPPRLQLSGIVELPVDMEALAQQLEDAPGEVKLNLTPLDDGTPFRLNIEKTDGGLIASGKVPAPLEPRFDGVETSEILRVGPAGFEEAASAGLRALAELPSGRLSVQGSEVRLTGEGTRAAISRALAALAALPAGFAAAPDLSPLDDGLPLGLTAEKQGGTVTLIGKMPFGSEPSTLGLEAFGEAMIVSEVDAKAPEFTPSAQSGLRALAALENGRLVVRDAEVEGGSPTIIVSGGVSRAGLAAVNAAFADLPDGVAPVIDVVFADDGKPLHLLAEVRDGDITITGKLPFGSTAQDLGLSSLPDTVQIAEIDAKSRGFLEAAMAGLKALSALETGSLRVEEGEERPHLSLAGVAVTTASAAAAEVALKNADADVTMELTLDLPPALGSERVNEITNQAERFTGTTWVPLYDFEVSRAACEQEAAALEGILDAETRSMPAIPALAGIILHCLDQLPDLSIAIQARQPDETAAQTLLTALVDAGVPGAAISLGIQNTGAEGDETLFVWSNPEPEEN